MVVPRASQGRAPRVTLDASLGWSLLRAAPLAVEARASPPPMAAMQGPLVRAAPLMAAKRASTRARRR
jgi:hypothetical protein